MRLEIAAGWAADGLLAALRRLERKFSPNQPRVPAGNPDGGQWTDDARWTGGRAAETDVALLSGDQAGGESASVWPELILVGRGVRLRPGSPPSITINGRRVTVTPRQAAEIETLQAQAAGAIRDARAIRPGWKPTPGAYETPQGYMAQLRRATQEARDFVANARPGASLTNAPRSLAEVMSPNGTPTGRATNNPDIYLIPRSSM